MKYGAFGLVEVLGSCNAVMVIDQMLKTADVSFRTWNGKCGGHEVVFMSGDVSAVTAAVESVKQNPPCDIILAAVISNPSEETVRLVEEDAATHHFAKSLFIQRPVCIRSLFYFIAKKATKNHIENITNPMWFSDLKFHRNFLSD